MGGRFDRGQRLNGFLKPSLSSSQKLFKTTLHPKITQFCEASRFMLSDSFCTKPVLRGTFLKNMAQANPNIPLNRYWTKIWCILLEQGIKYPWISFTSSTELKSSTSVKLVLEY